MKIKHFRNAQGELVGYTFYCPGCREIHNINTSWRFNGDYEKPTIEPSILVQWEEGVMFQKMRCHSFIRNGDIQFLTDGARNGCTAGDAYSPASAPLRLYEKEGKV